MTIKLTKPIRCAGCDTKFVPVNGQHIYCDGDCRDREAHRRMRAKARDGGGKSKSKSRKPRPNNSS